MLTLARLAVDHVLGGLQSIDAHNPLQQHVLIAATGSNFIDIANDNIFPVRSRVAGLIFPGLDTETCQKCEW